ncbi:hypothetical protein [Micromonospora sp. WMMD1082]|uniref:hypothetical protein n=1 Tax=Micromonospora sp. WMMD1082 TaxID=3016104 RepID=UPI0024164A35|nr:hypothetical protein [Micromonospora sp. WMMD1082]MDG4795999.1 hypothetical protein [Micromonospora sp. WMMD1082]
MADSIINASGLEVVWPKISPVADLAMREFLVSAEFEEAFWGGPYAPEGYLESYFYNWLCDTHPESSCFELTNGNFHTFLEVTQGVIHILLQDPTFLNCGPEYVDLGIGPKGPISGSSPGKPRRILGIFDPNLDRPHCFDERVYEACKFRWLQHQTLAQTP